jgi:hypothetical protein
MQVKDQKKLDAVQLRRKESQSQTSDGDPIASATTSLTNFQIYAIPVLIGVHIVSSVFALGFPFYELIPELECKTVSGDWAS